MEQMDEFHNFIEIFAYTVRYVLPKSIILVVKKLTKFE